MPIPLPLSSQVDSRSAILIEPLQAPDSCPANKQEPKPISVNFPPPGVGVAGHDRAKTKLTAEQVSLPLQSTSQNCAACQQCVALK